MSDPYSVVRDFERALCEYTGAPYAVTTTSCTMALLLAVAWYLRDDTNAGLADGYGPMQRQRPQIEIPKRTYVGVPMSIIHAGGYPSFRDQDWIGAYPLEPTAIWDCARRFRGGMYVPRQVQCLSFHHTKILGISTHGGAILHDDWEMGAWLRRARFDGRTEAVPPTKDRFAHLGWHCYMTPPTAAEGLLRLAGLPWHNADLPNSDYPDLSKLELFN